ncbi:hypothetical protein ASG66_15690 [Bacillus sp. Leaf406]|nr:hypothetical protein ASG66_15690 [Bacillus sp. Leaf406]
MDFALRIQTESLVRFVPQSGDKILTLLSFKECNEAEGGRLQRGSEARLRPWRRQPKRLNCLPAGKRSPAAK